MIKSGGSFHFCGNRCIIGAVISIRGTLYIAAASHIFHGTTVGSRVLVEGYAGILRNSIADFDVALIELPPVCAAEITGLGSAAVMEDAMLANERHSIECRVTRAGASLLLLQFPCLLIFTHSI